MLAPSVPTRLRHTIFGLLVLSVVACERDKPTTQTVAEPAPVGEGQDTTANINKAVERSKVTAKAAKPRSKEYTDTASKSLGTLPTGVGLKVGAKAPELAAKDSAGNDVSLAELLKESRVLLFFYRGGWCPYCNFQVRAFSKNFAELKKRNIMPVAISVDQVSEANKTQASYEVPFPVLSDPDLVWHRAYNVLNKMDRAMVDKLKNWNMDVEQHSGRKHHTVAIPSLFLIEQDATVSFAHADENYKVRPKLTSLLTALDKVVVN